MNTSLIPFLPFVRLLLQINDDLGPNHIVPYSFILIVSLEYWGNTLRQRHKNHWNIKRTTNIFIFVPMVWNAKLK